MPIIRRPKGSPEGGQFAPGAHAKKAVMIKPHASIDEHALTDEEFKAKWRPFGFDRDEADSWRSYGFDTFFASKWIKEDFDPSDAREWAVNGFMPKDATWWRYKGFSPEEANAWSRQGFDPGKASLWAANGFDSNSAYTWSRDFGLTEATQWVAHDFYPFEANAWRERGFGPEEATNWIANHIDDPESAAQWVAYGYTPDTFLSKPQGEKAAKREPAGSPEGGQCAPDAQTRQAMATEIDDQSSEPQLGVIWPEKRFYPEEPFYLEDFPRRGHRVD